MVINVKIIKNSIVIKCNPIVPSKFKYKLLDTLIDLYTLKINDKEFLSKLEKGKISEEEEKEYFKCYKEDNFQYSFEEFLELAKFPVGTLELLSKENNQKVAFIDFVPDGDVNMIWIDVYDAKSKNSLFDLMNKIKSMNE